MPIKLDDVTKSAPTKIYTPKFFASTLTGSGGKNGILSNLADPIHVGAKVVMTDDLAEARKHRERNSGVTTTYIHFSPLTPRAIGRIVSVPTLPAGLVRIGEHPSDSDVGFYLRMKPYSLMLQESESGEGADRVINRKLITCYRFDIFRDAPSSGVFRHFDRIEDILNASKYTKGFVTYLHANPAKLLNSLFTTLTSAGMSIDHQIINEHIAKYSLYGELCKVSEQWQTNIDEDVNRYISFVFRELRNDELPPAVMNELRDVLSRLEAYSVPLPIYRRIYDELCAVFPPLVVKSACKANLNLMLSDTMNDLAQEKPYLNRVAVPTPAPQVDSFFSTEQRAGIMSDRPLVLVQSGAGTGKSTLIKGRLGFMQACGVNPHDITVLSFTNAAANHINDIAPEVHSMTIAKMIHSIYELNFPNHELSTEGTLANSLDIFFPNDPFAINFKRRLMEVATDGKSLSMTHLNSYVENHFDEVITCLNTIGQTTLNLEIIICYQKINQLAEPPEVASRHLIIDEVQDNSIFEFVYTLRYVAKHRESLFIVGDSSQTLYEWRSSNPRALNVMESSGVFDTYKLQINYRSNQEILDFANVLLTDIEANQYAQIQLQANSLTPVTSDSFSEKVRIDQMHISRKSELDQIMSNRFRDTIQPYIEECHARGEKVCFLAHKRHDVQNFVHLMGVYMPHLKVVSIMPERAYESTVFSNFIRKYWNEVQFMPNMSVITTICMEIDNRLDTLVSKHISTAARNAIKARLNEWAVDIDPSFKIWQQSMLQGIMSKDDMLTKIKEHMLSFEIKQNSIRQAVLSSRNAEQKQSAEIQSADVLVSTIHSAKGLEFENTIVLYNGENRLSEPDKRMYYVALTRAMHSELLLIYTSLKHPNICQVHTAIVDTLKQKEAAVTAQIAIGEDETISDDDVTITIESEVKNNVPVEETQNTTSSGTSQS